MGLFDFFKKKKSSSMPEETVTVQQSVVENHAVSSKINTEPKKTSMPIVSHINQNNNITLSDEQLACFNKLENTNACYFVTGKAGAGKSVVLRYFVANTKKAVAVVAPTGIAAINVHGQTIHSLFGMAPTVQDVHNEEQLRMGEKRIHLLSSLDTLIIDEASMIRADTMDMIDAKFRRAKKNNAPFGGCQVVLFGDLYQLPPVVGKSEEVKAFLYNRYSSMFFFAAPCIKNCNMSIIELNEVHRQKDPNFVDMLNKIRLGHCSHSIIESLNTRVSNTFPNQCITLVATNEAAKIINNEELSKLTSSPCYYEAAVEGDYDDGDMPTDRNLMLKVGAQVIMLKNDSEKRWVNGTVGTITELADDYVKVKIKDFSYSVDKETWTKYKYILDEQTGKLDKEAVGTFTQYPLKLAYAITIHKSQGQTYDHVIIDYSLGRAFADGQTYVALSRCKSFTTTYLKTAMVPNDIKASQEVIHFMHHEHEAYVKPIESNNKFAFTSDNRIKVDLSNKPKKISGTKFASVLGENRWNSPFKTWCELTGVYEEPFVENQYTIAGKTIEPKQYEWAKQKMLTVGSLITPEEVYGDDASAKMRGDFFPEETVFGGMWDYLLKNVDGKTSAVFEMKTTKERNRDKYPPHKQETYKLQAALYAWLMDVDDVYMVSSYVKDDMYDHPNDYVCSETNTEITYFKISEKYPDFVSRYVKPALKWWADYIETGISP